MKIVRYTFEDKTSYGIVEGGLLHPCDGDPFTGLIRRSAALDPDAVRLLPPVDPPNIFCIGLNYRKHAEETGSPIPAEPLIFIKATTSLCGPGDAIVLPAYGPDRIDYEAELAIVIGKRARDITEDEVPDVILGYTVANDVSNRAAQFTDGQWARGKSHDTFCPVGPAIVTDLDPDNLKITCRLDGRVDAGIQHGRHDFLLSPDRLSPLPLFYPPPRNDNSDGHTFRGRLQKKTPCLPAAGADCGNRNRRDRHSGQSGDRRK